MPSSQKYKIYYTVGLRFIAGKILSPTRRPIKIISKKFSGDGQYVEFLY